MRSDGDSWDITTSVGATALFVAAARALEAQKPGPLAVDPFAEIFCRAVGGSWADLLDGKDPGDMLRSEDFGKTFVDFQAARTRFFDERLTEAAGDGVRQVVILAAGLDSRAYRLDWPADTTVYELDRPQVLDFKREVLADYQPRAQRREIAIDLREDWSQALQDNGFRPENPSAWLAEGLLMYLPATAQGDLFDSVDSLSALNSHVAVEQAAPLPDEVFAAAKAGEIGDEGAADGYFSLIYNQQIAPAEQWFTEHGWRATVTGMPELLRRLNRAPEEGSQGALLLSLDSLVSAVKETAVKETGAAVPADGA